MDNNCKGLGKNTCNQTNGCSYAEGDKRSYCRSVGRNQNVLKPTSYQKKVISVKQNKKDKPVKPVKKEKPVKPVKKVTKKVIPAKQISNRSLKNIIPVKPMSNKSVKNITPVKKPSKETLDRWYREQH